LERAAFPDLRPPATAFRVDHRVRWHELDALRHVNNAAYVHYLEDAALAATAAAGWPLARWLEHGGRFRAVAHDLEYLDAALYDDALAIVTWTGAITSDAVTRHTLVVRDDTPRPLLRAVSRFAWCDLASGAATAMPALLYAALTPQT
jgi:acyl-CoA thioester hydrolase